MPAVPAAASAPPVEDVACGPGTTASVPKETVAGKAIAAREMPTQERQEQPLSGPFTNSQKSRLPRVVRPAEAREQGATTAIAFPEEEELTGRYTGERRMFLLFFADGVAPERVASDLERLAREENESEVADQGKFEALALKPLILSGISQSAQVDLGELL